MTITRKSQYSSFFLESLISDQDQEKSALLESEDKFQVLAEKLLVSVYLIYYRGDRNLYMDFKGVPLRGKKREITGLLCIT
jgi:hypothetical protein